MTHDNGHFREQMEVARQLYGPKPEEKLLDHHAVFEDGPVVGRRPMPDRRATHLRDILAADPKALRDFGRDLRGA